MSRFAIVRALLGAVAAMLRLFLRNVHRTLYGSCTTLAFIAIILVTFLAAPQAEELALARVEISAGAYPDVGCINLVFGDDLALFRREAQVEAHSAGGPPRRVPPIGDTRTACGRFCRRDGGL